MSNLSGVIQRESAPVRSQVERAMRDAIVQGRLAPGQRLVEADLCSQLGVSRPLLREALRQLVAEDLVVIVPNHGARVSSLTPKLAAQIYEVRGHLEGLVGRSFVLNAGKDPRQRLDGAMESLRTLTNNGADVALVLDAKSEFYRILVDNCGNQIVRDMLERLNNRISLLRAFSLSQPGRMPEMLKEMEAIHDAINDNDPQATYTACIEHVNNAARYALTAMRECTGTSTHGT